LKEDFWDHCATKEGINLQAPAVGPVARYSFAEVRGLPPFAKYAKDGAPGADFELIREYRDFELEVW
jgi:hypothetical protein